jgi:hypothetical protein
MASSRKGDFDRAREIAKAHKDERQKYNRYKSAVNIISKARRAGADEEIITNIARRALGIK